MLEVDLDLCIGCKICEKVCPFRTIVVVPETKKAKVLDGCTLCGTCVNACPENALSIERKAISEEEIALFKNVIIWGEWERKGEEIKIKNVVLELLGEGRDLANKLGESLSVILPGKDVKHLVPELFQHGADIVYLCEHELLDNYSTDGFTSVIASVISTEKPSVVLYGATPNGRDLAPRIAARLALGLTADCTGLDINSSRQLVQTRPAFGGNIMASILSPYTRPQMSTVRPGVFPKPKPDTSKTGKIVEVEVILKPLSIRTKIIEEILSEEEGINIEEANILVSAGRGIGSKENLEMIKEMAKAIDGTVSGSRALVDLGWIPHPQQVGQSGKTVAPTLYFALGISGAIQHLVGMTSSDTVIAINRDPDATIFDVADFGIVGDMLEIIPEFIQIVKEEKKKNL
ncbi:MAG: FAD-binding protein [Candidatus Heimdallarchaeaceae archaeon]